MNGEIALMLMSHGDFAKSAMESVQMVVGKQENYETMSICLIDNVEQLKEEMRKKASQLDSSKGLLVFTDIVGGTPMNLAGNLLDQENVLICSGLSLPLLLECIMNRTQSMEDMKETLIQAHGKSLTIVTSEDLKKEGTEDDLFL